MLSGPRRAALYPLLGFVLCLDARPPLPAAPQRPPPQGAAIAFEPNRGQTGEPIRFIGRGHSERFFVTPQEIIVSRGDGALHLRWTGAAPCQRLTGEGPLSGELNYFRGSDPTGWHTGIPRFAQVRCAGAYPGVDVLLHGSPVSLELDFEASADAALERLGLSLEGARALHLEPDGSATFRLASGGEALRLMPPRVFDARDGAPIACGYALRSGTELGFRFPSAPRGRPVVIDPVLVYSTYLGGGSTDQGTGIAVDGIGEVFVTGETKSIDFPSVGSIDGPSDGGNFDAFVTKFDATGAALLYSTFVGGSLDDRPGGIALDSLGAAYVAGATSSADFPLAVPLQPTFGGVTDAFVFELSPAGSSLVFSTFLGGSADDYGNGIAVDSDGSIFTGGYTASTDFPLKNPLQPVLDGGFYDCFVAELSPSGSGLVYSTYLGGSGDDHVSQITALLGVASVVGHTSSPNFPVTAGAFQTTYGGGTEDAFVSVIASGGTALTYSTYLGGSGDDRGNGLALDSAGNVYVTGYTVSPNFPLVNPLQGPTMGVQKAFISELNPNAGTLLFSTYWGGSVGETGYGIAVDSAGSIYVVGDTQSSDFPLVRPIQGTFGGNIDVFVTLFETALDSGVGFSSYLGGADVDDGFAIAVDARGVAYVTGDTSSSGFPTLAALQPTNAGNDDAFVSVVDPGAPQLTSITPAFGPVAGGTSVTIRGLGFTSDAGVTFGGVAAPLSLLATQSGISTFTPPHDAGAVDVVVTDPTGAYGVLRNGFVYVPPDAGAPDGGDAGMTSPSDGGSTTSDAGTAPADGGPRVDGGPGLSQGHYTVGCDCRAAPGGGLGLAWALMLGWMSWRARRRISCRFRSPKENDFDKVFTRE